MKISAITPSVREDMLDIVKKCLGRQGFRDFEWIVASPFEYKDAVWVKDPPKRPGDYYSLNKAWNKAFAKAKGDLIVSIVDGLWFAPDLLERLWSHYNDNPMSCVTAIGHQYDKIENGKPEHMTWRDPRARTDIGAFYEIKPWDCEFCVASVPRKGIVDVGGIDEEFDKYAALSEKEMAYRMDALGYKFYIDQTLEYRAISHPRLSEEWDKKYNEGWKYFDKCISGIQAGQRIRLDYLK